MSYDWLAAIVYIVLTIGVMRFGPWLVFKVPAFEQMRQLNREVDQTKMSRNSFREAVEAHKKAGTWTRYAFYALLLPFCVCLERRPIGHCILEIVAVLALFDLMYYLTHRFLFHGPLLREVHALHHQARKPTFIDAVYVHPVETIIGVSLFLLSIPIVAWIQGRPLNVVSAAIAAIVFMTIATVNHTYVNLPRFPFKWLDNLTGIHAAHHLDMKHGNYATLTTVYDRLFGTYEKPVKRPTAA
ncbi:MAG: sterol desaturase family protein [Myxococcota bacterium]